MIPAKPIAREPAIKNPQAIRKCGGIMIAEKRLKVTTQIRAVNTPLVTVPPSRAQIISFGPKGGISKSTILPCTLALVREDEVLAKAFCKTAIIIKPGAKNWIKLSKLPSEIRSPTATANTIINKVAVIAGPNSVCTGTFKNRITSLT